MNLWHERASQLNPRTGHAVAATVIFIITTRLSCQEARYGLQTSCSQRLPQSYSVDSSDPSETNQPWARCSVFITAPASRGSDSAWTKNLLCGRETVRSSNAATVLRTLVPQARAIFRLLAEHQMEDRDEGEEEGQSTVGKILLFDKCPRRALIAMLLP